eukprot:CAMPEP_0198263018 /NCGR_PEP_ID=MMETSP1447-20131203/11438_1 /TAXON_ID=420782 /ORGANISM="Chaetoceros dichaeta, Strain CCMP1751" /LENGTH=518 /DNA_ID=CAMNT_0043951473 /DNA_START=62 /DNA_END=1618 /DNA_ORIENTATION=-
MTLNTNNLQINDKVTFENPTKSPLTTSFLTANTNNTFLQGEVVFLGSVSFASGDDWVGIRLTGDSVGHGTSDGTVQGVQYFDQCDANNGVFVRKQTVRPRAMNRLDELRMKKEMEELSLKREFSRHSNSNYSVATSSNDDEASVSSFVSGGSTRSRLEEIRRRRLATTTTRPMTSPAGGYSGLPPKHITGTSNKGNDTINTDDVPIAQSLLSPPSMNNNAKKFGNMNEQIQTTLITLTEQMQNKIKILSAQMKSKEEENVVLQLSLQNVTVLALSNYHPIVIEGMACDDTRDPVDVAQIIHSQLLEHFERAPVAKPKLIIITGEPNDEGKGIAAITPLVANMLEVSRGLVYLNTDIDENHYQNADWDNVVIDVSFGQMRDILEAEGTMEELEEEVDNQILDMNQKRLLKNEQPCSSCFRKHALLQEVTKAACKHICGDLTVAHTQPKSEICELSLTNFYKVGEKLGIVGEDQIVSYVPTAEQFRATGGESNSHPQFATKKSQLNGTKKENRYGTVVLR